MKTDDRRTTIRAAMTAAQDCADTMDVQADSLLGVITDVPMDAALRAKAVELCATLKDRAGRVAFELVLLENEVGKAKQSDAAAIRRLVGLDATMMEAVAPLAELADELERAAEREPAQEQAFVLVIEAAGAMLRSLDRARAATAGVTT